MKRLLAFVLICGMAFGLSGGRAFAQIPQEPFNFSTCNALSICCSMAIPAGQANTLLYGIHVSNQSPSAAVYLQLFNTTAQPSNSTVPIGASSWLIASESDRDISVGEVQGMPFNKGIEACCSTTQGTFTAPLSAPCGIILESR